MPATSEGMTSELMSWCVGLDRPLAMHVKAKSDPGGCIVAFYRNRPYFAKSASI